MSSGFEEITKSHQIHDVHGHIIPMLSWCIKQNLKRSFPRVRVETTDSFSTQNSVKESLEKASETFSRSWKGLEKDPSRSQEGRFVLKLDFLY